MSNGPGMSPKSLDLIESTRLILEEINPATVRGVCYKLFTQGVIGRMSKQNTDKVSRLLARAREEGMIAWEHIVDETRREELETTWEGLGDYGESMTRWYRKDFWRHQPAWIKVFSEKATVGGVVRPILDEFAVGFQVMHGYGSATSLRDIAMASLDEDKPILEILYIGDFDPSGMHMSEVDLPERIDRYGGVVNVTRIALRRDGDGDDCAGLPSFDADTKTGDPRYQWFKANHGDTCWELDAMDPNDLRERLREEIEDRIAFDAWDHCQKTENAERESLNNFIKAWPRG